MQITFCYTIVILCDFFLIRNKAFVSMYLVPCIYYKPQCFEICVDVTQGQLMLPLRMLKISEMLKS